MGYSVLHISSLIGDKRLLRGCGGMHRICVLSDLKSGLNHRLYESIFVTNYHFWSIACASCSKRCMPNMSTASEGIGTSEALTWKSDSNIAQIPRGLKQIPCVLELLVEGRVIPPKPSM